MSKVEHVLIVPAIPPTGNSYVRHTKAGGHYKTKAVETFEWEVAAAWNHHHGHLIEAESYAIDILVQIAPKKGRTHRQDLDNFAKCGLDALMHCGIILDDSRVTHLSLHKQAGDADETVYTIRALNGSTESNPVPMVAVPVDEELPF